MIQMQERKRKQHIVNKCNCFAHVEPPHIRVPYTSPTKYSHRQPTQKLLRLLWSWYSISEWTFFLQWLYSVLCTTMFSFLYKAVCNETWTLHCTSLICDYWYQLLLLLVLIFSVAFMVMVSTYWMLSVNSSSWSVGLFKTKGVGGIPELL